MRLDLAAPWTNVLLPMGRVKVPLRCPIECAIMPSHRIRCGANRALRTHCPALSDCETPRLHEHRAVASMTPETRICLSDQQVSFGADAQLPRVLPLDFSLLLSLSFLLALTYLAARRPL